MKMALDAVIEAIFVVLGPPKVEKDNVHLLCMDKWLQLVIAESQLALGLTLNTRRLEVGITRKYLAKTLKVVLTVWFKGK